MKNLVYSPCSAKEIPILAELCKTTFQETYASYNTPEDMQQYLSSYFNENRLSNECQNPLIIYQIAWHNDQAVGYIKLNFAGVQTDVNDQKSLELERIYVLKSMQGSKIGKALLNQAIAITQQHRLDYLWLGVWKKNTKAIGFYTHLGFQKFGEHTFLLGQDEQVDDLMKFMVK